MFFSRLWVYLLGLLLGASLVLLGNYAFLSLQEKKAQEGAQNEPQNLHVQEIIQKGDTLFTLFLKHSIPFSEVQNLIDITKKSHKKLFSSLNIGDRFHFTLSPQNQLISLVYSPKGSLQEAIFRKDEEGKLRLQLTQRKVLRLDKTFSGVINGSFYQSAVDAGLDNNMVMSVGYIFQWDVDFAYDIRNGDRFDFQVEEVLDSKTKKRLSVNIIAARFVVKGVPHFAYRREDDKGLLIGFYNEHGVPLKKQFLRTPLSFAARVSSHFNPVRVHPLFKSVRPHLGTDYAAPRNTFIHVTGNGRVAFAGHKRGYGNVIYVDHGRGYQTRYAHQIRFAKGIKKGVHVHQGQVIGYVGKTGYATGYHVHYEFRVHGKAHDSEHVVLPKAPALRARNRTQFLAEIESIKTQFEFKIQKADAKLSELYAANVAENDSSLDFKNSSISQR